LKHRIIAVIDPRDDMARTKADLLDLGEEVGRDLVEFHHADPLYRDNLLGHELIKSQDQ
jgi:hypothetical protein